MRQQHECTGVGVSNGALRRVWQIPSVLGLGNGQPFADRLPKARNAERLVDGGNVFGQLGNAPPPYYVINVKDGKTGKILPYPRHQLRTGQPGHVVVGHNQIEVDVGSSSGVQRRPTVRDGYDFIPCIRQNTDDEGTNHRLVIHNQDAPGHGPSAECEGFLGWDLTIILPEG
jgi:hypothetical protein